VAIEDGMLRWSFLSLTPSCQRDLKRIYERDAASSCLKRVHLAVSYGGRCESRRNSHFVTRSGASGDVGSPLGIRNMLGPAIEWLRCQRRTGHRPPPTIASVTSASWPVEEANAYYRVHGQMTAADDTSVRSPAVPGLVCADKNDTKLHRAAHQLAGGPSENAASCRRFAACWGREGPEWWLGGWEPIRESRFRIHA
jgi:hypothetical protein